MGNDELDLGSFEGTPRALSAGSGFLLFPDGFPGGLVTGWLVGKTFFFQGFSGQQYQKFNGAFAFFW